MKSNYEIRDKFCEYATKIKVYPATLAISWVLSNPIITTLLIGVRNVNQLEASLAAVNFKIDANVKNFHFQIKLIFQFK